MPLSRDGKVSEVMEAIEVGADDNLDVKDVSAMTLESEAMAWEEVGVAGSSSGLLEPSDEAMYDNMEGLVG